jgi:ribosomal protein L35AE/L33A
MRHLRLMQQRGMVEQNSDGTWERLRFDADALAEELGIPDTVAMKRARHQRERQAYLAHRLEWCEKMVAAGGLTKSVLRGKVIYSAAKTGVVVEEFTDDTMHRNLANRRAV